MWVLFKHFIIEYRYCKMPRNFPLNENENGQISAYKLEISISFIAKELLSSRTVVRNYLKDPELYGTKKRPGRPPWITNAARRQLFREASKGQSSSRNLQKSQNLSITLRVHQLLHESPNLVYRNGKKAPALTGKYKKIRVDLVKKKVTWTKEKWKTVVFSYEKKFNLDGLDGSQCY